MSRDSDLGLSRLGHHAPARSGPSRPYGPRMKPASRVLNRAASSMNSAWPASPNTAICVPAGCARGWPPVPPANRADDIEHRPRWSRSPPASRCAAPDRRAAPGWPARACAGWPRSGAPDSLALRVTEHAGDEAVHGDGVRQPGSRALGRRASGGGSSPTELSTSTSPAIQVAVCAHIGQRIQHAERPAHQQHRRRREIGDQFGDVLAAPVRFVAAVGRVGIRPGRADRMPRRDSWREGAELRLPIQAGMVQPGTKTMVWPVRGPPPGSAALPRRR